MTKYNDRSYKRGSNCSVNGCPNYKLQRDTKSFFRMPKDPNLLKTWVAACNNERLNLLMKSKEPEYFYSACFICSDHFQLSCYRNKNLFSQGLIPGSVPTVKVFNVPAPIEEKIPDKTQQVEIEKIWIDEESNEELAAAVVPNESASLPGTSTKVSLTLEEENIKLRHQLKEYRQELRLKNSLLLKCRERNRLLEEKLLQQKIGQNAVNNVPDQKVNFIRINLDEWE